MGSSNRVYYGRQRSGISLRLSSLGALRDHFLTDLFSVSFLSFLFGQGVVLAVTSLVMTLAQDNLEAFSVCYQKAVDRLSKVSNPEIAQLIRDDADPLLPSLLLLAQIVLRQEYPADYVYYKVPIPWLQVKLLRLLQYYPPSSMLLLSPSGFFCSLRR